MSALRAAFSIIARVQGANRAVQALKALTGHQFESRLVSRILAVSKDVIKTAAEVTHVDTSTLQTSHVGEFANAGRDRIRMIIDESPRAINPKHGLPASVYGPIEHGRGGSHAYYLITWRQWRGEAGARFYAITFTGWRP